MITSTWFTTRAAVTTLLLWRVRIAAICHQRRAVARAATPPNGHLEVIGSWILPAVRPGQVRVYAWAGVNVARDSSFRGFLLYK